MSARAVGGSGDTKTPPHPTIKYFNGFLCRPLEICSSLELGIDAVS